MPTAPETMCQQAKDDLERAKRNTADKLKLLDIAEGRLEVLEAAQPPDTAAIEAQKAAVKQARADWKAAREVQKERKETVDDLCNPHP